MKTKETKTEHVCEFCGHILTEEETRRFNNVEMCESCFNSHTTNCDCCGKRIWRDDAEGNENTVLCERCYNEYYTHCERCGRLISYDDACYFDGSDEPYCNGCYDVLNNAPIHDYGYKPEPIFYGDGSLYMGVELEIDEGGECDSNAEILLDTANAKETHIYCKHDGSIDSGFEIVSHPMTLDYHTNCMPWQELFRKALSMGYYSHQTDTCGLHVHVNRNLFGKTYQDQEDAISRVVYFVENHWNELLKFSRRTEANMNRWASRYGISTTAKDTYKKAKDKHCGRYVAVNLENYSTIEFRLFRGTLRYKTFIATLQLVEEICRHALQMDDCGIEGMSWSEFVTHIPESKAELIEYLKMKRLYVNEEVR